MPRRVTQSMASIAHRWGIEKLAAECFLPHEPLCWTSMARIPPPLCARWMMLKQYLGEHVILSRARAKVLWRHDDHAGAVAIMRLIADRISPDSPIARCFALREAAISAAKTGDWAQAERWFDEAKGAGEQAKSNDMPPMAIGLGVDAAVAAFQNGDRAGSVKRMAESLTELRSLDSDSSLRAAYCHRVTRHAVLWLQTQIEGQETLIDNQPIQVPPGTCSNPEPLPAIKELPLGPIDFAWYMLAQAEIGLGEECGILRLLPEKLEIGPIPVCEVMLRGSWMQRAIKNFDVQLFALHLNDWVDGISYLHSQGASPRDSFHVLNPTRGEIPSLSSLQRSTDYLKAITADAILALLMRASLEHKRDIASLLKSQLTKQFGDEFPGSAVFSLLEEQQPPEQNLEQVAAVMIRLLNSGDHLVPLRVWEVGLRLFERVRQSNFKNILVPSLAVWMRSQWLRIISEERFRLPHPITTVPKVEEILKNNNDDVPFIAALCLYSADAVEAPLASDYRQQLRGLAAS